jgi:RNA polymerase sigma-70 factor, ECF subfamily
MDQDVQQVELVQKLFLSHMAQLRGWIFSMVRNSELADDLIQETFLTVYKKADCFEQGSNFRAWVYAIARLKILEASRRPALREICFEHDVLELLMPEESELPDNSETIKNLNHCIAKLQPTARRAILMRYRSHMSPPAIAHVMKWTVNAIHVTLSRARISLRACIERSANTRLSNG